MSKAYKCDRCEQLFTGGDANDFGETIAYLPQKHSFRATILVVVSSFVVPGYIIPKPNICRPCLREMVLLALGKEE